MKTFAAVTNLDTYQIEVHRSDCADLRRHSHYDVDIVTALTPEEWAEGVFGEVEEVSAANVKNFVRYIPCYEK